PQPNPYASRDPQVHTSEGRHRIMDKLSKITLNEVIYEGLPLSEVIKNLTDESRRRDPDQQGINFMIVSNIDAPIGATQFATDPATGAPIAIAAPGGAEAPDVGSALIEINPPLTNMRLRDVLDAIVKVADQQLKWT
ncbi:MAG TPA: hypothetical protein DCY13_11145, partial [Verrucomicrobiales bacterium]|nr:hypothetical protein [Verrucomicrobiales bacterium]